MFDAWHVDARIWVGVRDRHMVAGPKSEEVAGFDFNLVGRSQVISELVTELEKFFADGGGVCALTGAYCLGKTRVAKEFASYAKRRGTLSLWVAVRECT